MGLGSLKRKDFFGITLDPDRTQNIQDEIPPKKKRCRKHAFYHLSCTGSMWHASLCPTETLLAAVEEALGQGLAHIRHP